LDNDVKLNQILVIMKKLVFKNIKWLNQEVHFLE